MTTSEIFCLVTFIILVSAYVGFLVYAWDKALKAENEAEEAKAKWENRYIDDWLDWPE